MRSCSVTAGGRLGRQRRDYVYLTHRQVLALADETEHWRLLIPVLAYTGLRWGEATVLRVCDIDFDRRCIDVRLTPLDTANYFVPKKSEG